MCLGDERNNRLERERTREIPQPAQHVKGNVGRNAAWKLQFRYFQHEIFSVRPISGFEESGQPAGKGLATKRQLTVLENGRTTERVAQVTVVEDQDVRELTNRRSQVCQRAWISGDEFVDRDAVTPLGNAHRHTLY